MKEPACPIPSSRSQPWLTFASDDASDLGTVLTVMSFRQRQADGAWIWAGIYLTGDVKQMMLKSPTYAYLWTIN